MGCYFQNEPKNIHNTIKKLFIYYSHNDPLGMDGQTDGQTDRQTDRQTNIYSLLRDKISLPEGSLDITFKQRTIRIVKIKEGGDDAKTILTEKRRDKLTTKRRCTSTQVRNAVNKRRQLLHGLPEGTK